MTDSSTQTENEDTVELKDASTQTTDEATSLDELPDEEGKLKDQIMKLNIIIQTGRTGQILKPKFIGNEDLKENFKSDDDDDDVSDGLD